MNEESFRLREITLKEQELAQRICEWEDSRVKEREQKEYDRSLSARIEKNLTAFIPLIVGGITLLVGFWQIKDTRELAARSQDRAAILNAATEEYRALLQARKDYYAARDTAYDNVLREAVKLKQMSRDVSLNNSLFDDKAANLLHEAVKVDSVMFYDDGKEKNSEFADSMNIFISILMLEREYILGRYEEDSFKTRLAKINKVYNTLNFGKQNEFNIETVRRGLASTAGLYYVEAVVAHAKQAETAPESYPSLEVSVERAIKLTRKIP